MGGGKRGRGGEGEGGRGKGDVGGEGEGGVTGLMGMGLMGGAMGGAMGMPPMALRADAFLTGATC